MHADQDAQLPLVRPLMLWLLTCGLGACAQQAGQETEAGPEEMVTQAALDAEMLTSALSQEASLEAAGVVLRERAWLSPDAFVASYETPEGTTLATQLIGKNSLTKAIPTMLQDETFDDFALRATNHPVLRVKEIATDTVWFKPASDAETGDDRIGKTVQGLSDLELVAQQLAACDSMARSNCNETVGYYASGWPGPTTVAGGKWTRTAKGAASFTARGSAFYVAVCAHAPQTVFQWTSDSYRFYSFNPAKLLQNVPPLAFFSLAVGTGWRRHTCGFLEICSQYVDFNQWTHHFSVMPLGGGNGLVQTFCGNVTDQNRINFSNDCNPRLGSQCTGFEMPTNVSSSFVSN